MTSEEQRPVPVPAPVGALGLLALAVFLLCMGGFVQFDDYSGFGSNGWIRPLGFLAAVAVVGAVVVACASVEARRWLGGGLVVLDLFVIWQSVTNDAFRFVWHQDEGELFLLQVALGLTAFVLIATGLQPSRDAAAVAEAGGKVGAGRWLVRTALYLAGTAAAVYFAFFIGLDQYEDRHCTQVGSCDADDLSGLVWGLNGSLIALGVCVVLIVVVELVLRSRRKQQREASTPA